MADTLYIEPEAAIVIERDGLRLVVDPVALAAIRTAQRAGIESPASFGGLPDIEDLPLLVMALEARIEALERDMALIWLRQ